MQDRFFIIVYFCGVIVGTVLRSWYTRAYRTNTIVSENRSRLDSVLMVIPAFGMLILPLVYAFSDMLNFADYRLSPWAGWVGTAQFTGGLVLLWRSHADLGSNWSPSVQIREGHTLVTHGVFKRIRHPMYAAHFLWGCAQPLLLQNWIAGFSMLVTLVPLMLVRVPREERMMLERFGEEYRSYMRRTVRGLPFFR